MPCASTARPLRLCPLPSAAYHIGLSRSYVIAMANVADPSESTGEFTLPRLSPAIVQHQLQLSIFTLAQCPLSASTELLQPLCLMRCIICPCCTTWRNIKHATTAPCPLLTEACNAQLPSQLPPPTPSTPPMGQSLPLRTLSSQVTLQLLLRMAQALPLPSLPAMATEQPRPRPSLLFRTTRSSPATRPLQS